MWVLYFCFGKVKLTTLHNNKGVMVGHIIAMRFASTSHIRIQHFHVLEFVDTASEVRNH